MVAYTYKKDYRLEGFKMARTKWSREMKKEAGSKLTVNYGGGLLVRPFLLMILLGAIHSAYHNIPALSFKITWFISMCFLLVGRYFQGHNHED